MINLWHKKMTKRVQPLVIHKLTLESLIYRNNKSEIKLLQILKGVGKWMKNLNAK